MPESAAGLRRRVLYAHAATCAIATAVCCWFVAPVVNFRHLESAAYWGDVRLNAWALAWNHRVLSGNASSYWDANIFHPAPQTLALSEHLFGIAVPTFPLYLAGADALLVYNLAWLASFPLLALAVYALARHVGLEWMGATAAGLLAACSFVRIQHVGHLQLLWSFGLPLSLLYLDRWRTTPRTRWLVAWVAATLAVCLASWYLTVLTIAALAVWAVPCVWPHVRRAAWRHVAALAGATAIVAVVLFIFALPYGALPPGPIEEVRANSADWASYLVPARATPAGHWLTTRGSTAPRWSFGEQTLFLGWVTLLLAACGTTTIVGTRVRSSAASSSSSPLVLSSSDPLILSSLFTVGVVAIALSLGPGDPASDSLPTVFDLLRGLPGMALVRAPARFALTVSIVVAVLAGLGVATLARTRRWLAVPLVGLALLELRPVHYELPPPQPERISPLYDHLARLPVAPVVSLPVAWGGPLPWYDADYEWYATRHWRPIVNGFSRGEPAGYATRMTAVASFPDDTALDALCAVGTRYVVAHAHRPYADFTAAIAAATHQPRLQPVARDGGDRLWSLSCKSNGVSMSARAPRMHETR